MNKIIIYLILSIFSFCAYAEEHTEEKQLNINKYVAQLVQDGLNILNNNNLTENDKISETKKLVLANLDLNWMAKYTLGVYRRKLNTEQITEFTEAYGKYVSKVYAGLVKNYKGQDAKVQKVRSVNKGEFLVEMLISTTKVNYLVREFKDEHNQVQFKVSDVITEGVSLINSQQAEFMNILSNSDYDSLINQLNKKS